MRVDRSYARSSCSCLLPLASCLLPLASCLLPLASCLLPLASCLLPLASCLLPLASCLLPLAACRLPLAACRDLGRVVMGGRRPSRLRHIRLFAYSGSAAVSLDTDRLERAGRRPAARRSHADSGRIWPGALINRQPVCRSPHRATRRKRANWQPRGFGRREAHSRTTARTPTTAVNRPDRAGA